jgi:Zn-dependent peptidase ImmA (M78 family)
VLNAPRETPILDIVRQARKEHGLELKVPHYLPNSTGTGQLLGKFFFNPPVICIHHDIIKTVRFKFTLAHEFAHFYLHRNRKIQVGDYISDSEDDVFGNTAPARKWMEWQANRFAAALLVPRKTVSAAVDITLADIRESRISESRVRSKLIHLVAVTYDVSDSMMRYRLRELGFVDND